MPNPTVDSLLEQSIAAYNDGDRDQASVLLSHVFQLDANNERAWLWLSGVVLTDAERLFCIKRMLSINPRNEIAQRALSLLPAGLEPVQPSLPKPAGRDAEICTFPGCSRPVTRAGYKFCYKHWKAVNGPLEVAATLNATALGEKLNLSNRRMNLVLAELGWTTKERRGWVLTPQGQALGAVQKEHSQTGVPYVLWPETILSHKALLTTIRSLSGEMRVPVYQPAAGDESFREKFAAPYRATYGHWVRSKAEMLIDNWLYMSGIPHAYERELPIEEELYCDFYIPAGKVYLEYWGMENDGKYAARKAVKQELYRKYKLNLIELTDEHVKNLDDYLPKMLLKLSGWAAGLTDAETQAG
jgi:hypothetical protein